mmetsp:Transcript_8731/g.19202  ORF Transcript_8731/g.19202 Transcript_8731/m.19202 type:complete len:862 (-) Transcript_8731:239-2824(-)
MNGDYNPASSPALTMNGDIQKSASTLDDLSISSAIIAKNLNVTFIQNDSDQLQETRDRSNEVVDGSRSADEHRIEDSPNSYYDISNLSEIEREVKKLKTRFLQCIGKKKELKTINRIVKEHISLEAQLSEAEISFLSLMENGLRDEINIKVNSDIQDPIRSGQDMSRFLSYYWSDLSKFGNYVGTHLSSLISSVFFFMQNNPAGLIEIVELVRLYEESWKSFEHYYVEHPHMNKVTNIRDKMWSQLYQAMKRRAMEDFKTARFDHDTNMKERSPDDILPVKVALTTLTYTVSQMDEMIEQFKECFPSDWHIDVLWGSCIGYVCSYQILRQVSQSGTDKFTRFNVSELLELTGWLENYQITMVKKFPTIGQINLDRRGFVACRPALFYKKESKVTEEAAISSLAWVTGMFKEIHSLSQNEFLNRMQDQVDRWLDHVYANECIRYKSNTGQLTTSLCEDIFSLVSVQIGIIREHVNDGSEALVQALCMVFRQLKKKQIESREKFLVDVETCSAAANDFTRMGDLCDEVMKLLREECSFPEGSFAKIENHTDQLLLLFSTDAVFVAQYNCLIIFEPIVEAIAKELFHKEWELVFTDNQLILTLVRTVEDYLADIILYLDSSLIRKLFEVIVQYTVNFYLKCLLMKTSCQFDKKKESFLHPDRALLIMFHDVKILKEFFVGYSEKIPNITSVVASKFSILDIAYENLHIAAGLSRGSKRKLILALLEKIGDVEYTKLVMMDLWHLVAPKKERSLAQLLKTLEDDMNMVMPPDKAKAKEKKVSNRLNKSRNDSDKMHDTSKSILVIEERGQVPGIALEDILFEVYFSKNRKSTRKNILKTLVKGSVSSAGKVMERVRSLSPKNSWS